MAVQPSLPPIDSEAEHIDVESGRPSKDFYNWIKSISTRVNSLITSIVVGNPAGGDKGTGSINAQSIYINGQAIVPAAVDPQLSALLPRVNIGVPTAVTDAHVARCLFLVGPNSVNTCYIVLPAGLRVGAAITITNWSGSMQQIIPSPGALYWIPTLAGGTRNLASGGLCTAYNMDGTNWFVTGSGLT